jgi:hypothetical protein
MGCFFQLKNPSTEKLQLKKKVTKGIFLSCRALDVTFFEIRLKRPYSGAGGYRFLPC